MNARPSSDIAQASASAGLDHARRAQAPGQAQQVPLRPEPDGAWPQPVPALVVDVPQRLQGQHCAACWGRGRTAPRRCSRRRVSHVAAGHRGGAQCSTTPAALPSNW